MEAFSVRNTEKFDNELGTPPPPLPARQLSSYGSQDLEMGCVHGCSFQGNYHRTPFN